MKEFGLTYHQVCNYFKCTCAYILSPLSFLFCSFVAHLPIPSICLSISVSPSLVFFTAFVVHVGLLFPQQKEPAYAAIRMGFALGYILGFLVPLFATFSTNLWIEVGLLLISLSTYSLLYFKTQTKEQMFPCCYRNIIQKSNE